MPGNADIDVQTAVVQRWNSIAGLTGVFTGGFTASERWPAQTNFPRAKATTKQGPKPNDYFAPGGKTQPYIDYRHLVFTLQGPGKAAVGALVGLVREGFDDQPLSITNATFLRIEYLTDYVSEEPETKLGNDIYRGCVEYCVWSQRVT